MLLVLQLMLLVVQLMLPVVLLMLLVVQLMLLVMLLMLLVVQLMRVSVRIRSTQSSYAEVGTELGNKSKSTWAPNTEFSKQDELKGAYSV